MSAPPPEEELRAGLCDALQETDADRPLDSLETVVVQTFLRNHGLTVSTSDDPEQRPENTIEGWVAWARRHSPGS